MIGGLMDNWKFRKIGRSQIVIPVPARYGTVKMTIAAERNNSEEEYIVYANPKKVFSTRALQFFAAETFVKNFFLG